MTVRVGGGLDVHAFDVHLDRPLVLCGVRVAGAPALAGHSDADVGAHAVADALLGAAALGDLGQRFGIDRPETADADSLVLLAAVVSDVHDAGWRVGNVDLTLVAQRPRLAAYRLEMRERLATACSIDVGAVSVGFSTTDRLGSIGRGEGIAGWCTCLLVSDRG